MNKTKLVKKASLVFTVSLLTFGSLSAADAGSSNVQAAKHHHASTIRVTYTLKNNKKKIAHKSIKVKKNTTVLGGLKKCWKVKADNGFVTSIHGYSQNKGKKLYWTYKVNGKWAQAANKVKLHNHDKVVWTRSKY